MTTAIQSLNTNTFATKGDIVTAAYSKEPVILMAVYASTDNTKLYVVTEARGTPSIHKMSITRNTEHARAVFKAAKKMIGQQVLLGVTAGWSSDTWFNDVIAA